MSLDSIRPHSSGIPPLRVAMGSALGFMLANAGGLSEAAAQTPTTPAPTPQDSTVRLQPIAIDGDGGQQGYQSAVPALPKLSQSLLDTPQSINVVPKQLMEDQGITTTRDALRNVPGISLAAGEAGAQGDNLTIRGFTARNDFFLDGMRDFGSYYRDPFNVEQIEVLKGPASVLFGRGSTGGVVHQVSKQPTLAPITAGTIAFGTDGTQRITSDMNRAIDGVPGAAVRLNVMGDLSGVAGRSQTEYRRFGVAPSVAFGLGTDTRLYLNYLHQQEDDTPDYGLPWLYGSPAPVKNSTYYGYKDSDYLRTTVDMATARLEHDFDNGISLRNQFRFGVSSRSLRITEPQVVYTGVTPSTSLSKIKVTRNVIGVNSEETLLDNQTDATVHFSTGPIEHTLVTGLEFSRETSAPTRYAYTGLATTSLLSPNPSDPFNATTSIRSQANTTVDTGSVYVLDTLKWGPHWELTAGVRLDEAQTDYKQNVAPAQKLSRSDSMPSTRLALSYKPAPNGTFYVSYGTSFNPSAESLSLATNTADLAPEKNETYEVGTKWDVLNERLSLTGALFQIEKLNARVTDPNNSLFNILGGDQRVRGFEIGATGRITEAWQVYAGYAYLDTKVVKTTLLNTVGNQLANVPQNSFNAFTSYMLPWHGIQIGAGVNYLSSRIASSTPNTTTKVLEVAPGYTTVQAMVKVPVREGVDFQVNGSNLTNTRYYDLLHPSHVVPGAGRSLLFSLNMKL